MSGETRNQGALRPDTQKVRHPREKEKGEEKCIPKEINEEEACYTE